MVNAVLERTARKGLEEALLHSQKMKAVGQLTGGLAHDFNNLLAVIIGSLALTVDQLPPGTLASRIERARAESRRAWRVTDPAAAGLFPQAVAVSACRGGATAAGESAVELLQHSLLPGQHLVVDAQRKARHGPRGSMSASWKTPSSIW